MVDSPDSRVLLPPAELVKNRIAEKRFFEARFLFNKFSQAIDSPLREQIQQQLENSIVLAEQALASGELLEQSGKLKEAADAYKEVVEIARDHPSVPMAQQRVEIAIKLEPLHPVDPLESKTLVPTPSTPARSQVEVRTTLAEKMPFFRHQNKYLLFAFSLLASLGIIAIFSFFRPGKEPAALREVGPVKTVAGKKNTPATQPFAIQPVSEITLPLQQAAKKSLSETGSIPTHVEKVRPMAIGLEDRKEFSGQEDGSSVKDDVVLPPPPQTQVIAAKQPLSRKKQLKEPSELTTAPQISVQEDVNVSPDGKKMHVRPLELLESKESTLLNNDGTYTVQPSDSLRSISRKLYGNSWRWDELYKLNSKQLLSPGALEVGQVLQVNREGIVINENRQPEE